jgi:hypothetical protein
MIEYSSLLAAKLNLSIDYTRMAEEIHNCKRQWIRTPIWQNWIDMAERGDFFKVESDEMYEKISRSYKDEQGKELRDQRELDGFYNLYLTSPELEAEFKNRSFNRTKYLDHQNWNWRLSLRHKIPYTIKCIESLPYKKIGLVRVFITENTFFPTHFDYEQYRDTTNSTGTDDLTKTLGLSLIPQTGGVPLKIWSDTEMSVKSVEGNAMIFRDSQPHGVPYTADTRLTIRIFGEIDFDHLDSYVDPHSIIY